MSVNTQTNTLPSRLAAEARRQGDRGRLFLESLLEEAAARIQALEQELLDAGSQNFLEQESEGPVVGSNWADSVAEPNRYLHARAPRGAEARLAGEVETGRRCGW